MLSRNLAENVALTKILNLAGEIIGQIQPAVFRLAVHTPIDHQAAMEMDVTALWHTTRRDIVTASFTDNPEDLGFEQAGFPQIVRKKDAGYFAYPL
jgi:metallopeptidase MepB